MIANAPFENGGLRECLPPSMAHFALSCRMARGINSRWNLSMSCPLMLEEDNYQLFTGNIFTACLFLLSLGWAGQGVSKGDLMIDSYCLLGT